MLEARMSYNQLEACLKEEKENVSLDTILMSPSNPSVSLFLVRMFVNFQISSATLKRGCSYWSQWMVELSMAVSHLLKSFHGRFPLFCCVALFSIIQKLQNLQSPCHCPAMCWNGFVNQIIREKKRGTTKFGSCSPGNLGSRRWKVWEKGI